MTLSEFQRVWVSLPQGPCTNSLSIWLSLLSACSFYGQMFHVPGVANIVEFLWELRLHLHSSKHQFLGASPQSIWFYYTLLQKLGFLRTPYFLNFAYVSNQHPMTPSYAVILSYTLVLLYLRVPVWQSLGKHFPRLLFLRRDLRQHSLPTQVPQIYSLVSLTDGTLPSVYLSCCT